MKRFNGFPTGGMRFITLPDLFFVQLLPQINDLVELKVTLHFLWMHARQTRQMISRDELLADETLVQSLIPLAENIPETLTHGLTQSVKRGTLLYTQVEDEAGCHDLYFLNSERGRQAQAKVKAGEMGVFVKRNISIANPVERANIFELYEDNIGLISPILADELKEAELLYPAEWIEEAFKIAAEHNVRHWKYVRAVLQKMTSTGRNAKKDDQPWYDDEKFRDLFDH
jgi:DnaD/phage-associated family protein